MLWVCRLLQNFTIKQLQFHKSLQMKVSTSEKRISVEVNFKVLLFRKPKVFQSSSYHKIVFLKSFSCHFQPRII